MIHLLLLSSSGLEPDRTLHRHLIEACAEAGDEERANLARQLLVDAFQSLKVAESDFVVPEAIFQLSGRPVSVRNGPGIYSSAIRHLVANISSAAHYQPDRSTLPESGYRISQSASDELIILHCEKQALAAILEADSKLYIIATLLVSGCRTCITIYLYYIIN